MKWDGTMWTWVGTPGFSFYDSHYQSLVLDSYNNPIVAYIDTSNGYKLNVKQWTGSLWQNVGANEIHAERLWE